LNPFLVGLSAGAGGVPGFAAGPPGMGMNPFAANFPNLYGAGVSMAPPQIPQGVVGVGAASFSSTLEQLAKQRRESAAAAAGNNSLLTTR